MRLIGLLAVFLCLNACSFNPAYRELQPVAQTAATVPELKNVPFFPQDDYECGPAALATVLQFAGSSVTPAELVPQIQVAQRRGSLQIELQAASRRHGYLPYVHKSGFEGLMQQLQADVPVLILQNLGLSWAPTWHYAVVVGYLPEDELVLLRSGRTRLQEMSLREFARSWAYSEQWFMTVHPAGEITVGADVNAYLSSVAGLERAGQLKAALAAYATATTQWPEAWMTWMGRANVHYQLQQHTEAEQFYRRALALAPDHPAPNHNLAWALLRQDRRTEALPFAETARRLSDQSVYQSAWQELQAGRQ